MGQHIFRIERRAIEAQRLQSIFTKINKNNYNKIWHTNIITIIITMKTKRHARAARISTNIITITTTNMMKKVIITTTTITTME